MQTNKIKAVFLAYRTLVLFFLSAFLPLSSKSQNTFTYNFDSTIVIDKAHNLMWMRYDYSYLKNRFFKCWDSIFVFEKEMNVVKYGGFNDWKVPTISEYRTINNSKQQRLLYRKYFSEADSVFVWGKGPYSFWSNNEKGKYVASYISFIDGFATSGDKCRQVASGDWEGIEFAFSVRLVRRIKNK